MKTLIAYYSYTGTTAALCKKIKTDDCDMYEIRETGTRGKFSAYVFGCFKAIRGSVSKIEPVKVNIQDYDLIILACPAWASSPAPALNAFIKNTDFKDKRVIAVVTSMSGINYTDRIRVVFKKYGITPENVYNVKAGDTVQIIELED